MKIFFRHLLLEFLGPLLFCLVAGSALWVIADLFGTLDDFVSKKAPWTVIVKFYAAQVPNMLVVVLPMAVLFASLYTLLQLTRHQELVALQAGGISPMALFLPFFAVTALLSIALFYIHGWPATQAEARRERLLLYMRGSLPDTDVYGGIIFYESLQKRLWYVQSLNLRTQRARGLEVLSRNASGADVEKVFAQEGLWNGKSWDLSNAKDVRFASDGSIGQSNPLATLTEPTWTVSPQELVMSQAQPDELTLLGLARFLQRSRGQNNARLAPYRTQFWQCWIYPSTLLTFLVFAFAYGTPTSRQRSSSQVFGAVFVLIGYFFAMHFFLAMGRGGRIPGFLAAAAPFLLFGSWGAYKLGRHWHLDTLAEFHWKKLLAQHPHPFLLRLEALRSKAVSGMERLRLLQKD